MTTPCDPTPRRTRMRASRVITSPLTAGAAATAARSFHHVSLLHHNGGPKGPPFFCAINCIGSSSLRTERQQQLPLAKLRWDGKIAGECDRFYLCQSRSLRPERAEKPAS